MALRHGRPLRGVATNSKLKNVLAAAKIQQTRSKNGHNTRQPPEINTADINNYLRQDPRFAELQDWFKAASASYDKKDGQKWKGYSRKYRELNLLKKEILKTLPFGPITKKALTG